MNKKLKTNPTKNKNKYLKHRDYFLTYQAQHRPPRKYPYCVVCGLPNESKKLNQRLIKTCSDACSAIHKRIMNQQYHTNSQNPAQL